MAEVAVDERRLLKTMRWWDGVVIGMANPGFLLVGLAFSILAMGGIPATIVWIVSAVIGALQAYVYAEPAAMFPDKPGGLSVYAREGWRKYFSLAGPIAVFGYWFAWSSVLAIYGVFVGLLLVTEFGGEGYFATTAVRRSGRHSADHLAGAHRRHVHPALLHLQHPRHAPRGVVLATSSGALMILPGRRHRDRRLPDRRLLEPPDRLEPPRRHASRCTATRQRLPPVRAGHGLALHHRLVDVRPGGGGHVRAGVQGHDERHPQGARRRRAPSTSAAPCLLPIAVLGTIGYDGILADALRRPVPRRRAP